LRAICAAVSIPVFAIGGVTAQRAAQSHEAGAHGVAVMRAVWDTPDVEAATREFV
jgi:thiamine-phosphate pyrophosphorylase